MTKPASSPPPITPRAAQRAIEYHWAALPIEHRPLGQCTGQILRQDIYAERDNPPFDRVCMGGIAISSATLARGLRRLTIGGMQAAGSPQLEEFPVGFLAPLYRW